MSNFFCSFSTKFVGEKIYNSWVSGKLLLSVSDMPGRV